MTSLGSIVIGGEYDCPPNPPRSDWERDLQLMANSGMNTVKFWACWSWMNPERDHFDFEDLDALMEIAGRVGLKVVLNVILEDAPYWLEEDQPEARYCDGCPTFNSSPDEYAGGRMAWALLRQCGRRPVLSSLKLLSPGTRIIRLCWRGTSGTSLISSLLPIFQTVSIAIARPRHRDSALASTALQDAGNVERALGSPLLGLVASASAAAFRGGAGYDGLARVLV